MIPSQDVDAPDQFVASFGKDAALGCFTLEAPSLLSRGDRVVLNTPRGLELGNILCPANVRQARLLGAQVSGRIVRRLGQDDLAVVARLDLLATEVLESARTLAEDMGLAVILLDVDVFFDGHGAVLQLLHDRPEDLAPFVDALSRRHGIDVRLANLSQPAEVIVEDDHGCGKPDCGQGGSCTSCSTGGCSSCGSGATDLRPYFAHLRDRMESSQRVPLN